MAERVCVDPGSAWALRTRAHLAAVRADRCPACMGDLRQLEMAHEAPTGSPVQHTFTGACGSCGLIWTAQWGRFEIQVGCGVPAGERWWP